MVSIKPGLDEEADADSRMSVDSQHDFSDVYFRHERILSISNPLKGENTQPPVE